MKILLTLLIAITSIKAYSEILYCAEEQSAGIHGRTDKSTLFELKRYSIEVDTENLKMHSEELYFYKNTQTIYCNKDIYDFMCFNAYGTTFILHLNDYTFAISKLPQRENKGDLIVSRGKCEKF